MLGQNSGAGNKQRVLVVDDIPRNIQLISNVLHGNGLSVSVATSGEQAIRAVTFNPPDLILLDVSMPNMDGFQVCEHLKADFATKHVPIIFLTARVQPEDIVRGFEVGAADFVTKPFNVKELIARVSTHLELKKKTEDIKKANLELEEKVQRRTHELANANDKLASLDNAKNDFLHLISHELRTPLNGIIGFLQMLETSNVTTEQKELIRLMNDSAEKLVKLSDTALLITSIKADSYVAHKTEVSMIGIFNALSVLLESRLLEKQLVLQSDIPNNLVVVSDKSLLISCLVILVENAIEHSPVFDKVLLKATIVADYVVVSVADNGKGFSESDFQHMFSFFTNNKTLDNYSDGFGLGLATAKLIMETLEGKIEAVNKKGGGAQVSLMLKLGDTPKS